MLGADKLKIRSDSMGDGQFGAPRGDKTHRGIDYLTYEGQPILSPVAVQTRVLLWIGHRWCHQPRSAALRRGYAPH